MIIKIINKKKQWDDVIKHLPERDIYFEYDYHCLYKKPETEIVEAFYFSDNEQKFFFPYIKRKIANHDQWHDFETVYGYTGPLFTTNNSDFILKAWDFFREYAKSSKIVCGLIRFHPFLENSSIQTPNFITKVALREIVYLDLNCPYPEIWSGYNKGTKSDIKKAKKEGLTIKIASTEESFLAFYNYYIKHMQQIKAEEFYIFKKNYFLNLYNLGKDKSKTYFVYFGDKIIGGAIILYEQKFCHYHLGWSLIDYNHLRPNKFMLDEIIKYSMQSEYKYFNLGGGITNSADDSLLMFKKHFSKNTKIFHIGKTLINDEKYTELCNIWQRARTPEVINKYKDYFLKYNY